MFTGQSNRTDLSEFANQLLGRGNVALGDDSEAAFALLDAEALGLAGLSPEDNQYPGIRATIDNEFGLLATDDYGAPHAASKFIPGQTDASGEDAWQSLLLDYNRRIALGSGARERQFNDQDNELESPDYSSSMGRLTSQNRTAQVEPVPDNPSTIPDADGQPETSASVLHQSQLAAWVDAHALTRSSHPCAMYCRFAMEAAGLRFP
jgi:hypothetical protein